MSLNVRPEDAQWDPVLNQPSVNQEQLAKAVFEIIQAVRKEASVNDPDSPGELSPVEILQVAISKAPGAAAVIVGIVQDDVPLDEDLEFTSHLVFRQLTGGV